MIQVKHIDQILDDLHRNGYAIIEQAIDATLIDQLLNDCINQQAQFVSAGIGRRTDSQQNLTVRSDKTLWFEQTNAVQASYITLLDDLKQQINRNFYMGLFDFECHYATYQAGDFYQKHLDAFRGQSNRVLSTVCYLNTQENGGELLIYDQKGEAVIERLTPKAGTLVIFESERFPHQVLAAKSTRYSIAGWFRTNNSSAGFVDPAQ
ncbi:MAG: 2OG-Fe(II) oxygenase [Psychrobium sp.]|nr:2OG-Fe(II) oxygenase [Psychrobium sp.]